MNRAKAEASPRHADRRRGTGILPVAGVWPLGAGRRCLTTLGRGRLGEASLPLCQVGFTLLELLVVIVIIAVLAGLLLPALVWAKHTVRVNRAKAECRELAKAWSGYWDAYKAAGGLSTGTFDMDDKKVAVLEGLDDSVNTNRIKFMDCPAKAETSGFKDPWKTLYKVEFEGQSLTSEQEYNNRVFMGNRHRYSYD